MSGFWIAPTGTVPANGAYSETVGDGVATSFTVAHGLGTSAVIVQGWDGGALVEVTSTITDDDTVQVTFPSAPAAGQGSVIVVAAGSPTGGGLIEASYDLYGPNTDGGLVPQDTSGAYDWSEDAVTANVQVFDFDQEPDRWNPAVFVYWRVVWLPASSSNGVRLVHADSGPSNITEIVEFTGLGSATPTVSGAEITTEFNALLEAGAWKQLGMQVKHSTGMRIYASRLSIVWETGGGGGGGGTASPLTTKGDLYTHDGVAGSRLAAGAAGSILTPDAAEATGLRWADLAELVRDAGRWEAVVSGSPAEVVTTPDGTDWVYAWVED